MNIESLVLPFAYLIIAGLFLWLTIHIRGKWHIKCIIIIFVCLFTLPLWHSMSIYFNSHLGWPTKEETPDRFILIKGAVREPNPLLQDEGAIYFWLIDYPYENKKNTQKSSFLIYNGDPQDPRAHKLPYSRKLHELLNKAEALQRMGMAIVMEKNKKGDFKNKSSNQGKEGQYNQEGIDADRNGPGEQEFIFYQLPPPKFEHKE